MIIWSIALLLTGLAWLGFWRYRIRPCWLSGPVVTACRTPPAGTISVIIPARNEARTLPALLARFAADGAADTEIIVVDDGSIDETPAIVRDMSRSDGRIRLVRCPPKPSDWAGKNWALAEGIKQTSGEWLVFCDADVNVAEGSLTYAMSIVGDESLDCLSLIAGMTGCRTGPALLLACLAVSRALIFSPAAPGRRGLVQGGFLVVKRSALEAVGGHASDKDTLLEDVELGYRLHAAGFRVRAYPAHRQVDTRMYDTFDDTREGLGKHLFAAIGFSFARLVGGVLLHVALVLFPFVSALAGVVLLAGGPANAATAAAATLGILCGTVMYAIVLRLVRAEALPLTAGLLVPLAYFGFGAVLIESVNGYERGAIAWKGRSYARPRPKARTR